MRCRILSLLLTLISAGVCISCRGDRAKPMGAPATEQRSTTKPAEAKDQPGAGDDAKADARPAVVNKVAAAETHKIEVVEEKYDNGVVRKRVEGYRDDKGEFVPHGVTATWYESGLKWTEMSFKDGVKQGQQRKWYNTGAEWSNGFYDDGVEHGVWTAYHPNGEKAREIHVNHGVWDGPYIEYHKNGHKSSEVTFVKGVRQGVSTVWDEDGSVAYMTDYIDGVEQP